MTREITLFDGSSASAAGTLARIERVDDVRTRVHFEARDAETVVLPDPFPSSVDTTSIGRLGLYLAKSYEDGATLVARVSENISLGPSG